MADAFASVKEDLNRIYDPSQVGSLNDDDVQVWSERISVPRAELYDRIAIYLAEGFHTGELTFDFCDNIVNDLHGVITFADECRPELYWRTYLAFDAGEYCRENNPDDDPVATYTRPEIARIVGEKI